MERDLKLKRNEREIPLDELKRRWFDSRFRIAEDFSEMSVFSLSKAFAAKKTNDENEKKSNAFVDSEVECGRLIAPAGNDERRHVTVFDLVRWASERDVEVCQDKRPGGLPSYAELAYKRMYEEEEKRSVEPHEQSAVEPEEQLSSHADLPDKEPSTNALPSDEPTGAGPSSPELKKFASGWTLRKNPRFQGYSLAVYEVLERAYRNGEELPKAHQVLEAWRKAPPGRVEITEIGMNGFKWKNDEGFTCYVKVSSLSKTIGRFVLIPDDPCA